LLHLIQELSLEDSVIYTGDVEDIKPAIAALDVLVLSSAQPEPFGGVVVEAMALSRPVVATCIGGSIEQVVDGVTGYLVKPADPLSMAAGIEKLLESPEQRRLFGENGRARFVEKFEFESFYRKILGLYQKVTAMGVHWPSKR
jgi:glycosyltransferase involved in cell wall biosynthesis